MSKEEDFLKEALNVISDGREELRESKKVLYDKRTGQISIKIPKSLALKKKLNQNSIAEIVVNPNEETKKEMQNSGFVIYFKEVYNGEEEFA